MQQDTFKIEMQIKALSKKMEQGKSSNPFALRNKIEQLKKKLQEVNSKQNWEQFLSR